MAFSRKINIISTEYRNKTIFFTEVSLKGDKGLTKQQIILRIIFWCFKTITYVVVNLLSYFFVKKYLLVGASSMLWTGQWMSQYVMDGSMDESVSQ